VNVELSSNCGGAALQRRRECLCCPSRAMRRTQMSSHGLQGGALAGNHEATFAVPLLSPNESKCLLHGQKAHERRRYFQCQLIVVVWNSDDTHSTGNSRSGSWMEGEARTVMPRKSLSISSCWKFKTVSTFPRLAGSLNVIVASAQRPDISAAMPDEKITSELPFDGIRLRAL